MVPSATGGPARTDLLVLWDAHDPHGLHGLLEQVLVLLPGDGDVPVGQEAVFVVRLQQEVSCEGGGQGRVSAVLQPEVLVNTETLELWEAGRRP